MAAKDVLLDVLEKFTSPYLNLTPHDKLDPDGNSCPPQPTWAWVMSLRS
jgi:type I restriction enzyme M protein